LPFWRGIVRDLIDSVGILLTKNKVGGRLTRACHTERLLIIFDEIGEESFAQGLSAIKI
jgi:hypothetical protein